MVNVFFEVWENFVKMFSLLKDDGFVGGGMRDGFWSTRVVVLGDFCIIKEDELKYFRV